MTAGQRDRQQQLRGMFSQLMGDADDAPAAQSSPEPEPAEAPEPKPERPARKQARTAKPKTPAPAPAAMPIAQAKADTARPQRLMVPLSVDEDRALKALRVEDGVPAAARIRAMLQLYRTDDRWRRAVDRTVKTMR